MLQADTEDIIKPFDSPIRSSLSVDSANDHFGTQDVWTPERLSVSVVSLPLSATAAVAALRFPQSSKLKKTRLVISDNESAFTEKGIAVESSTESIVGQSEDRNNKSDIGLNERNISRDHAKNEGHRFEDGNVHGRVILGITAQLRQFSEHIVVPTLGTSDSEDMWMASKENILTRSPLFVTSVDGPNTALLDDFIYLGGPPVAAKNSNSFPTDGSRNTRPIINVQSLSRTQTAPSFARDMRIAMSKKLLLRLLCTRYEVIGSVEDGNDCSSNGDNYPQLSQSERSNRIKFKQVIQSLSIIPDNISAGIYITWC